jgi:hypothetical protein
MEVVLKKSTRKHKKWMMDFGNNKVHFGDDRYQDYTQHHDKERQKKYITRHAKDPHDYDTAGQLSRVILWSADSLS